MSLLCKHMQDRWLGDAVADPKRNSKSANSNNQQVHALIYCHVDYLVCCDNIGHVPVDC